MNLERLNPIYIEQVIQDKNPKLYKSLPKFALSYLKRIIHQDEMNEFIASSNDKFGADFAEAYLKYGNINVTIRGEENLPKVGDARVIFAGNHSMGGLDGIALIDKFGHHYPDFKIMVNDLLMHILNLRPVFLPINKHGGQARDDARKIVDAHESDCPIFTYPAGLVSRRSNGVIRDPKWGKNVISNAINYKRDVIPVHISGRNSNFFYNLSNWRKRLGIKMNLEMFFLVDEVWKNHNTNIVITVGKTVSYKTFTNEKTRDAWADDLKSKVYALE